MTGFPIKTNPTDKQYNVLKGSKEEHFRAIYKRFVFDETITETNSIKVILENSRKVMRDHENKVLKLKEKDLLFLPDAYLHRWEMDSIKIDREKLTVKVAYKYTGLINPYPSVGTTPKKFRKKKEDIENKVIIECEEKDEIDFTIYSDENGKGYIKDKYKNIYGPYTNKEEAKEKVEDISRLLGMKVPNIKIEEEELLNGTNVN